MSHSSSSGLSQVVSRAQNRGVPTKCWCGEKVVTFTSTTKDNPYRRFYRCGFAMQRKKENHLFTWVDDALIEEIGMIKVEHRRLVEDVEDVEDVRKSLMEKTELQKEMFKKMEEDELTEKLEKELDVTKDKMEKMGCEMAKSLMKMVGLILIGLCLFTWLFIFHGHVLVR